MEGYDREFWQFSDQLRLQTTAFSGLSLGDSIWSPATGAGGRRNNNTDLLAAFNKMGSYFHNSNGNGGGGGEVKSYFNKSAGRAASNNSHGHAGGGKKGGGGKHGKNEGNGGAVAATDKRFKTLPASEALPRGEAIGGYIFVCNNDTMDENLRRELFGEPLTARAGTRTVSFRFCLK
ncbi:DCD (Development and Cell Death) domain protein [Zea mays]|uniref:DCD (Development and Cell Death) domain protein n=1 Tax=Zea mays TaxID=4577 RepID=A0A1D6FWY8_MAIZE|nr:DCD (Development and Cell Death) domain protein [Zea mays]